MGHEFCGELETLAPEPTAHPGTIVVSVRRTNSSALLAVSTGAVAFFGFSSGPRQPQFYWVAVGAYLAAVVLALLICVPIPSRVNVAYDTKEQLVIPPSMTRTKIYFG